MSENISLNLADSIHLASGLFDDGAYAEAEQLYRAAELAGGGFPAINGLGMCLNEMERPREALAQFDKAYLILRDEMLVLTANRAKALMEAGEAEQALAICDGLLKSQPHDLFRAGRAAALMQMGRYKEAIAECDNVLATDPSNDNVRFTKGFANLILGNYWDGFADYECRLKDDIDEPAVPLWTGAENLDGKTILVHGESGLGDNIMFARYVPMLVDRGAAKVIVVVPDSQRFMFERLAGVECRSTDKTTWPPLDYWIRFMSLAWCFKTTGRNIPAPVTLLYTSSSLAKWRERICSHDGLRVGLVWSGSKKSRYDSHRSIPLAQLAPLFDMSGVTFFSLQKDVRDEDSEAFERFPLVDIAPELATFEDTASALKHLDLMVTVDTSIAHMAGTVGVPTRVMLTSFRTYWLWIAKTSLLPWYPSIRVLRQERDGDWESVVSQVAAQLRDMIPARKVAC